LHKAAAIATAIEGTAVTVEGPSSNPSSSSEGVQRGTFAAVTRQMRRQPSD